MLATMEARKKKDKSRKEASNKVRDHATMLSGSMPLIYNASTPERKLL